jgi:hypothetical protein
VRIDCTAEFLWQVDESLSFLELIRNVRTGNRDVVRGPLAFIADQAEILNPALLPLWVGGVIWLFVSEDNDKRRYRFLAWTFLVVLTTFNVLKAKNYYVCYRSIPCYSPQGRLASSASRSVTELENGHEQFMWDW